jgi:hypothetical protein
MMPRRVPPGAALAAALALLLAGCGKGPYPVKGVVLLDGAPVDWVTVSLTPEGEEGRPATAVTGKDGSFEVSTQAGTGALPGAYRVTLRKVAGSDPPPPPWAMRQTPATRAEIEAYKRLEAKYRSEQRQLFPKRYLAATTTPVRITVPVKETVLIEVNSKESPAGDGK